MRRLILPSLVLLLSLFLTACASGGGVRVASAPGSVLPAPDANTASSALQGASDYRIGGQDLLAISVFGVDDLSKEVRVNAKGQISLPLIGTVAAAGKTTQELEAELKRLYSANYLQNPQVSVFVKEYASQRITVEGEVAKPGIFPISDRTTLLQALALAGGIKDNADLRGVVIMRQVDGRRMVAAFDLRQLRSGAMEDPEVFGGDTVVVETSGSKTLLNNFIRLMPALGVFRWY